MKLPIAALALLLLQWCGEGGAQASRKDFCVEGDYTPIGAGAWSAPVASQRLFVLGYSSAIGPRGTAQCNVVQNSHTGAGIICKLTRGAAVASVELAFGDNMIATPAVGSTHKLSFCHEDGHLAMYWDRIKSDYQNNTLGAVVPVSRPSVAGRLTSTTFSVANFRVTPVPYPSSTPKRRFDILALGDSIALNPNEWQDIAGRMLALTPGYQVTWSLAAYGSNTMGNGFLELSDDVQVYEGGRWVRHARWKPLTSYQAVSFNYMTNECPNMTATEFRRGLDKIASQATKYIPRTIIVSPNQYTDGGFTAWTESTYHTCYLKFQPIATKYGVPFVDEWTLFPADTVAGNHIIADLMRDTLHPTNSHGAAGIVLMANALYPYLTSALTTIQAAPEITGSVVSYLFGKPTAGSWALTSTEQVTNTLPGETPLWRVARLPDEAMVTTTNVAKLSFPTATFQMLFVHGIGSGVNGTFDVVTDRGLGGEVRTSFTQASGGNYPRSFFVKDWGAAGVHTVEVETTSTTAVNIVGVSYVGVP